jgi:hypothetical protein
MTRTTTTTTRTTSTTRTRTTITNSEAVTNILLNVFRKAQKFPVQSDDGLRITEICSCVYIFIYSYI